MGLTFRKRIKILPWLWINLNKRSVSITGKAGPVRRTLRRGHKPRTSVDLPGPFGYTTGGGRRRRRARQSPPEPPPPWGTYEPYGPDGYDRPEGGFDPER